MAKAKKLDRRIARTRRALGTALIELILELGYDKISIRKLTERADIGYATFYRHYKSKDELLTRYLGSILLEVANEIKPEKSQYEQYVEVFKALAKYKDAVLIGLRLPREHQAIKPLWQKVFDMVSDRYLARDESVIPLKVSVNHIIRSVSELVRWWLTEGQDYSPEQMAKMQSELIIKAAEQVAVVPRDAANRDDAAS
ncbi:MAG: TetR/AcrR family transcriptional regulator [Chloroflexi bacterium]|nr:TetR/AcrR family transcriptional regulator [Chloroflexota bacterium]